MKHENGYNIFLENLKKRRPGRLRHRCDNNIKIGVGEIDLEDVKYIESTQENIKMTVFGLDSCRHFSSVP
jgi:predicted RNA-binding protein